MENEVSRKAEKSERELSKLIEGFSQVKELKSDIEGKSSKTDIQVLEQKFAANLRKYKNLYTSLAEGYNQTNEKEKEEIKAAIARINQKLLDITENLYNKIIGLNEDTPEPSQKKNISKIDSLFIPY